MGLTRASAVLVNDAIVVLALDPSNPSRQWYDIRYDIMGHHDFRVRAKKLGFELTRSQAHSMLHRAKGRVKYDEVNKTWSLTAAGLEYRRHVLEVMRRAAS